MNNNQIKDKPINLSSIIAKQERHLSFVNRLLATRKLSELLIDRRRVKKAIDLAMNARLRLDPFYNPFELYNLDKEKLADQIIGSFISMIDHKLPTPINIEVPKNRISSRNAKHIGIKEYSIRYLLSLILSENIAFSKHVFGGKNEIFIIDDGSEFELEKMSFQDVQNSALFSEAYDWIVYIDIKNYYDSINTDILFEIVKRKLSLESDDKFLSLLKIYLPELSIDCWCDNFIQNIYFNDLDAILGSQSWGYYRMTDDIRIFCKSKEEAEMAFQIIKSELVKIKLNINKSKHFVLEPETSIERFKADKNDYDYAEISPILELGKINDYPVENMFLLSRCSMGEEWISLKYEMEFPRKLTYMDELLSKSGYKINGSDTKDVINDLEQKQALTYDDLKIVETIIFNTYSSHQFVKKVVRLFIKNTFLLIDNEQVENLLLSVFQKLSTNYKFGKEVFLSYVFLRVLFLENVLVNSHLFKFRNDIWNWILELIISNNYKFANPYILEIIKYIINNNLFQLVNSTDEDMLKHDTFWLQEIEKKSELKNIFEHSIFSNISDFLEQMFPTSVLIKTQRAEYYFQKKKFDLALISFLAIQPSTGAEKYSFEIGYCYHHIKDYQNAILYYSKRINHYRSSSAYNNRALIYQEMKKYDEALSDFTKALMIEECSLYFENRAICYMEITQYDKALYDLNKAIEIADKKDKRHYSAYKRRAIVKKELGDISGATIDIETYCNLSTYPNTQSPANLIKALLEDKLKI